MKRRPGLKKIARNLKLNQTPYEYQFGRKLRNWGIKYEAQNIIGPWIPDFYLPELRMIIELDGSGHFTDSGRVRDAFRDEWFRNKGYQVVHIPNCEVKDFQKEDLFASDKNGAVVVTDEGLPAYLFDFLAIMPE